MVKGAFIIFILQHPDPFLQGRLSKGSAARDGSQDTYKEQFFHFKAVFKTGVQKCNRFVI
jgi:hypothetical protein